MKLIKCHVENFGKLHDFDYSFDEDINTIHENNGWGKSTFATFIRVMFYGFVGENKRAIIDNERKKYKPWQMGTYGGNLVFSVNDKQYRMERRFGEKKSGTDEFVLYDNLTNLKSEDYSTNIGEELFGIDIESFMRTVFIAQQDCRTEVTPNISAKIGNVSDQTADMGNYDAVQSLLKKEMDRLTPDRATGLLSKMQIRISELKEKVRNKDNYSNNLNELKDRLEEQVNIKEEKLRKQRDVQEELARVSAIKDSQADAGQYRELCKQEAMAREKYETNRAFFPKEIPVRSDIEAALEKYDDYLKTARDLSLSEDEEKKLGQYVEVFSSGIPDETSLNKIEETIEMLFKLKSERDASTLSEAERKRIEEADKLFANYKPPVDEIDDLYYKWGERRSKKEVISTKKANAELYKNAHVANGNSGGALKTIGMVLLILGLLSVVGGVIALVVTESISLGAAIAGTGMIILIAGIILMTRTKKVDTDGEDDAYYRMLDEIEEDEDLIYSVEQKCKELYGKLGIRYNEYDVPSELNYIRGLVKDYDELVDRKNKSNSSEKEKTISDIIDFISGFFRDYNVAAKPSDFQKVLYQLKSDVAEYIRIINKQDSIKKAYQIGESIKNEIVTYIVSLGFDPDDDLRSQLSTINERCISLDYSSEDLAQKTKRKQDFEIANDVSKYNNESDTVESGSVEELNKSFNTITGQIDEIVDLEDQYRKQMDDVAQKLEDIENDESDLYNLQEDYDNAMKKFIIISKTKDYLEKAKLNFSSKYMGDIKQSFEKYRNIISDSDEEYELDANLNIKLKEKGSLHELDYLSEGYKDLVGLCRRMAMVDAMYDLEKPFLVFDDPFVNLDENRLCGATDFLNILSKEYQIIYFSCHQSRCG